MGSAAVQDAGGGDLVTPQVLGIIAGSLDRKVGRDLGLLDEKDAAFGLSTVSPDSWRDIQSDISDFTGCATAP
uniref:hypothetical protein n=1 Tax=Yoonia sp. TaxID=2212373 RepID=UPI0040479968